MLELARGPQGLGHVDVVDVNDNPRARARMSGLIASATIESASSASRRSRTSRARRVDRGARVDALGAHAKESATSSP